MDVLLAKLRIGINPVIPPRAAWKQMDGFIPHLHVLPKMCDNGGFAWGGVKRTPAGDIPRHQTRILLLLRKPIGEWD